jgi:hypothetical protein
MSPAERYLELGLQVGRHEEGTVDAYFGPPALAAAVEAAPPPEPSTLVDATEALLDELEDSWLRDQVVGLRTYAGVLAGEARSYADEVEGCYGVRPTFTDEGVFTSAHERLEELLPGEGSLAERLERWRDATQVPAERVEGAVAAIIAEARSQTLNHLVELPTGEGVALEIVRDVPWMAYNHYLGDLRGQISVNVDLPISAINLLHIALHETYPGHQAERACKEDRLVRGRGLLEETLVLGPTPQSVVSEGIAEIAPHFLLEGPGGEALVAVARHAGIELELGHAIAVERASQPLRWAEVNAALMMYDGGASEAETHAYLVRWGLMDSQLADHVIRFLTEPTSRSYVIAYPAGRELCHSYVSGDPDRFRRLLTEQVRVRDLFTASGGEGRP